MANYEVVSKPDEVNAPVLIVSFEDWVDAARAGTTAARHIAEGGDVVATFDSDSIYDYRSHAPCSTSSTAPPSNSRGRKWSSSAGVTGTGTCSY